MPGCSIPLDAKPGLLDKTLFPPVATAATRAPEAVTIYLTPADASLATEGKDKAGRYLWHIPVSMGAITEAAALLAFESEFAGGVQVRQREAGAPAPAKTASRGLSVALMNIRFDYRDDFVSAILTPIPLFGGVVERRDVTVRLAVDVSLLNENGEALWSASYDSGRELWKPVPGKSFWSGLPEDKAKGVQRMAHEQATYLLKHAAQDMRKWYEGERRRVRIL